MFELLVAWELLVKSVLLLQECLLLSILNNNVLSCCPVMCCPACWVMLCFDIPIQSLSCTKFVCQDIMALAIKYFAVNAGSNIDFIKSRLGKLVRTTNMILSKNMGRWSVFNFNSFAAGADAGHCDGNSGCCCVLQSVQPYHGII